MEQETWMTLLGFAGFGLAMMGYLSSMKKDLKADTRELRAELKGDIGSLRTELQTEMRTGFSDLKADIGRIDARLVTLENRTYDISLRLPPAPVAKSPHAS